MRASKGHQAIVIYTVDGAASLQPTIRGSCGKTASAKAGEEAVGLPTGLGYLSSLGSHSASLLELQLIALRLCGLGQRI